MGHGATRGSRCLRLALGLGPSRAVGLCVISGIGGWLAGDTTTVGLGDNAFGGPWLKGEKENEAGQAALESVPVTQPIFNAGRSRLNIKVAEAQQQTQAEH